MITDTSRPARASIAVPGLAVVAVLIGACLLYTIGLGRMPHPDEYHHMLAARGMLATGEPRIAEGLYTRGLVHTWLVAKSFALFGESVAAARVPSLIAMGALVALVFAWLRRVTDPLAAWLGAALFATSPFAVDLAQFCRFYALQALSFFLAAILVYAAVAMPPPTTVLRRSVLFASALAPLLFALYLQPTTLLGCVGLGLWVAGALGLPWLRNPAVPGRIKGITVVALLVLGLAVLGAMVVSGLFADLWEQYRWAPKFNSGAVNEFWYYHGWYALLYPTLWPATGLLALIAIVSRPAAGSFALIVFACGFLLNSFAATKSMRYIAYAQPFLFAIWGMGLATIWAGLRHFLAELSAGVAARLKPIGGPPVVARILTVGAVVFLVLANAAWVRTAAFLADVTVPPEQPRTNWPAARDELAPWLARADIVVSTEELGHLFFLGRYDVRFSPSKMDELLPSEQHEFGRDHRTGRPVISTRESLERILACYPTGIIVGPSAHWGRPELINNDLAMMITAHAQPLPLPKRSQLSAYVWEHASPPAGDSRCQGLPVFRHGTDSAG